MKILKRYALALFFLFFVIILMLFGTLGVEKFGNKLLKDTGETTMKPTGKRIDL